MRGSPNREECGEDLRPGKEEYQKCFEDIKYIRIRKRSGIIQCFTDPLYIPVDINIDQHLPQPQKKDNPGRSQRIDCQNVGDQLVPCMLNVFATMS